MIEFRFIYIEICLGRINFQIIAISNYDYCLLIKNIKILLDNILYNIKIYEKLYLIILIPFYHKKECD
jgi:hypothetical protein